MTSAYGRFQVVGPLAMGSLGAVARATDTQAGGEVALKTLHPALAANPDARARFAGAAQAMSRVQHPNLVRLIDGGEQQGLPFVAMELVAGPTLAALMQGGRARPLAQTAELIGGLAGAIDALHDAGLTHAAIRPDHVVIAPPMRPVLLGVDPFGGAMVPGVAPADGRFDVYRMPPEIAAGSMAGPATDIYLLAALAYQLLSGQKPYGDAQDPATLRSRVLAGPPVPLRSLTPGLPDSAYQALDTALSPNPALRYTRAEQFATILGSPTSFTAIGAPPPLVETQPSPVTRRVPPPDASVSWSQTGAQPVLPPAWAAPGAALPADAGQTAAVPAPAWTGAPATAPVNPPPRPPDPAGGMAPPAWQSGATAAPGAPPWGPGAPAQQPAYPANATAVPGMPPAWQAGGATAVPANPQPPAGGYVASATAMPDTPPLWGTQPPPPAYHPADATAMAPPPPPRRSRRGLLIGLGLGAAALAAGGGAAAYLLLFREEEGAPVSTVAGGGEAGFADGDGAQARFNQPNGIAGDGKGAFFVADVVNMRIRKVTSAGAVTTFAGSGDSGAENGPAARARFNQPHGVAVDKDGAVYVADYGNFLIRKISAKGEVTTLAGSGQRGFADGEAYDAKFGRVAALAVDKDGNVFAVDTENHAIRKITPNGAVTTLAGNGSRGDAGGAGGQARFSNPLGIAIDKDGNLYVADTDNNRIRKVTPAGAVTTLAGDAAPGFVDGTGGAARFNHPAGVAVDSAGNLFVADRDNHSIRRIAPNGAVSAVAGIEQAGAVDGERAAARFSSPTGVALGANGTIWVADRANHRIRRIKT